MRRVVLVGLSGLAGLAVGAAVAGSADAALPEFSPPFPNALHSTSKATVLQSVGGLKVTCKADTNKGEVTGPSTATLTLSLTGCVSAGARCQSANGLPGEIVTASLLAQLGYISLKPKEVGLDLSTPSGAPMASFFCGEDLRVEVFGSLIGRITPINKGIAVGEHATLKFAQKEGHEAFRMFTGGPVDVPEVSVLGGPLQEAGIASTDLLTFAAPVTILG